MNFWKSSKRPVTFYHSSNLKQNKPSASLPKRPPHASCTDVLLSFQTKAVTALRSASTFDRDHGIESDGTSHCFIATNTALVSNIEYGFQDFWIRKSMQWGDAWKMAKNVTCAQIQLLLNSSERINCQQQNISRKIHLLLPGSFFSKNISRSSSAENCYFQRNTQFKEIINSQ